MDKFTITDECINCDVCVSTAPSCFKTGNKKPKIFHQPTNELELVQCQEAVEVCPVDCIEVKE